MTNHNPNAGKNFDTYASTPRPEATEIFFTNGPSVQLGGDELEETNDTNLLQKSEDSEFKFFQLVEDTIIGLAVFFANFWNFIYTMIAEPSNFRVKYEINTDWLPRPFTLIALTVIFFSVQSQRVYVFIVSYFERQGNAFRHPSLQSSLENLTLFTAIKIALPTTIMVLILAALLVRLSKIPGGSNRRKLFHFVCYLASLQFFLAGSFFLAVELTLINEDWIFRDRDFEDPILEVGATGLIPLIIFFTGFICTVNNCIKIIWPIQEKVGAEGSAPAFKLISLILLTLLPCLGLAAAFLSEYFGWAGVTGIGWFVSKP